MPTPAASDVERDVLGGKLGVGGAAKQVAEHVSSLAKLELELAVLELKRKLGSLGVGVGLGVGAGVSRSSGSGSSLRRSPPRSRSSSTPGSRS